MQILNSKVDELGLQLIATQTQLAASNDKADKLISLEGDLLALVKQYQSSVPITDTDVQAVIAKIAAIKSTVTAISDADTAEGIKEDAALAAGAAAPAPAPAPADPPADPPAAAPAPAVDGDPGQGTTDNTDGSS